MSSETKSPKKPKKIKYNNFLLDFVRVTGCIPALLWIRPKIHYVGDKKKSKLKDGVLIASNHVTFFDPIALYCAFWYRRVHFLATKDLYKNKFFGWMLTTVGCIQVDKDNFSMASLHETIDRLKDGKAILIFPEGQVNDQEDTLSFKSGSVLMAKLGNVPILPVCIVKPQKRFSCFHIVIGEPVDVASMCSRFPSVEELQKVSDHLREQEELLKSYYEENISKKKRGNDQ